MKKASVDATLTIWPEILGSIKLGLKKRGYEPLVYRYRKALRGKAAKRRNFNSYPQMKKAHVRKVNLHVAFSPYADQLEVFAWRKQHGTPVLCMEPGFLPKTFIVDPHGFWGHSRLKKHMPRHIDELIDDPKVEQWIAEYRHFILSNNISKRKQPEFGNIDKIKPKSFIFLPMQYTKDRSVKQFCDMSYPDYMDRVMEFCKENRIICAVKKHPAAYFKRKETKLVDRMFKRLSFQYGKLFREVNGSIHWLCQNCVFMAGMNTGAIADGALNHTVTTHCGQSVFMNSGAVIHNNNVAQALKDALNITASKADKMHRRQDALIYYLYNKYLLNKKIFKDEPPFRSEWSNDHKVRAALDQIT